MREREREREREAETQAERGAGSMQGARCGTPGTPGSRPEPKAGAKPLSHPGIPINNIFIQHPGAKQCARLGGGHKTERHGPCPSGAYIFMREARLTRGPARGGTNDL